VLEIGGGTGANLPVYGAGVQTLTITEPEPAMLQKLGRKAIARAHAVKVLRAPAEDLPFEDGTFDTVVSTLVLCGVDDQPRPTLRTMAEAGFTIIRIEHGEIPGAPKFVRPAIMGTATVPATVEV
jgi:ubiquinone/menaquinone biosynthesis C-methylase UbiE